MKNKNIFITGIAGFIGFHLSYFLLKKKYNVYGIDNLNSYYSKKLKIKRLSILKKYKNFHFKKLSLGNYPILRKTIRVSNADIIINLAAQPGVRFSFIKPEQYIDYNIKGFFNILRSMEELKLKKLIYASSSSIYGDALKFPTLENSKQKSINLYGLTKTINENLAELYSRMSKINSFGLRFFTAYGSLGRPDMFIDKILNSIKNKKKIYLYNRGKHTRDFTHVSNVVEIIFELIKKINTYEGSNIFNVCSSRRVSVLKLIQKIEKYKRTKIPTKKIGKQKGDMLDTYGSNKKILKFLNKKINFLDLDDGLKETIFKKYKL